MPWWHLHRRLYDWTLAWAYRPSAAVALFCLAFAESSFFPVPPDVLLMPLVLGNRRRWFRYGSLCTLGSVSGGIAGFLIGWLLWAQVGDLFHRHVPGFSRDTIVLKSGRSVEGLVDRRSLEAKGMLSVAPRYPLVLAGRAPLAEGDVQEVRIEPFTKVGKLYETYDAWIVYIAAFTPIPYKVITITSGVFRISFPVFLVASIIGRASRFYLVAGLMRAFGPKITPFIEKYFNWLALLFMTLLIGGFVAIKYVS